MTLIPATRLLPWRQFTRVAQLTGLGAMLAFLPVFNVGMSIAGFVLAGAWLVDLVLDVLEGTPWRKFQRFASNKAALVLVSLFVLHVLGLLWTQDLDYGLKDLRVKLPLLFLPIVLAGLEAISERWFHRLMHVFVAAVVFSTFTSMWVHWGWVDRPIGDDVREITHAFIARISHIRLSLLATLAMAYATFRAWKHPRWALLYAVVVGWLLAFLWTIESVTGMGLALVLLGFFMLRLVWTHAGKTVRRLALAGLLVIWAGSLVYVGTVVRDYFDVEAIDPDALEAETPRGEPYFHDLENQQLENGHYVWTYVAWGELASGWNERSRLNFNGEDQRGQQLKFTLIRFLTSKGLRKDADGVAALTAEDVHCVEKGIASIAEVGAGGFRSRINKILLEVDIYRNGGNPGGNSVTQRLEFWRVGAHIFASNPVVGVGTGDVPAAFEQAYHDTGSTLKAEHRLRTHNQYLTMGVAFGVLGILWFLVAFIWPGRIQGAFKRPIYLAFFLVAALSFFTEDTLETQAGATFYAFFQSFLLLGVFWRDQRTDSLR